MSGDIVERLLDEAQRPAIREVCQEAADEIVRLRKRLQACQSNDDYPLTDDCITQNERFLLADNERLRQERQEAADEIVRLRAEVERLQAENDAYRQVYIDEAEFLEAFANWDGTRENLPHGWKWEQWGNKSELEGPS